MDDLSFASDDGRFQVSLPADMMAEMLVHCQAVGGYETGGILAGHYNSSCDRAFVTAVSGPPKDSRAGRASFARGTQGLSRWLRNLWDGPRHYYLGEWHFHPGSDPCPSGTDREQMRGIAASDTYHCPEPLLIIVGGDPGGLWTLSVHVFARAGDAMPLAPCNSQTANVQETTTTL